MGNAVRYREDVHTRRGTLACALSPGRRDSAIPLTRRHSNLADVPAFLLALEKYNKIISVELVYYLLVDTVSLDDRNPKQNPVSKFGQELNRESSPGLSLITNAEDIPSSLRKGSVRIAVAAAAAAIRQVPSAFADMRCCG